MNILQDKLINEHNTPLVERDVFLFYKNRFDYQNGMDLTLITQWLGLSQLETTRIYSYADTEQKRKAIAAATPPGDPLHKKLSPERFTVSDEDTLKRLTGLRQG